MFENPSSPASYILSYLDSTPPSRQLAIGTCTSIPPSPQTFHENPRFLEILNQVIAEHGHEDQDVVSQAQALVGPGGIPPASGGSSSPQGRKQGGSGGVGGWVHLSDRRNPPDFGRIPWPEDILGSVEVDQGGRVVGRVQASGTYRLVTKEGMWVSAERTESGRLIAAADSA